MSKSRAQQQLGLQLDWQTRSIFTPGTLSDNDLHLWCVPLTLDQSKVPLAISLLNDVQRDKYHRRASPALKQAYLAGRYHLLHLLAGYADMAPDEILLSYSRLNKPYLNPNPSSLQFNFTDTSSNGLSWGMFAFIKKREVGVDLECMARRSDYQKIVSRRFSTAEADYVRNSDGSIDAQRFLAYWTRKEAFGKATGRGISFAMREIDLASPGNFDLRFITNSDPGEPYQLQQVQVKQDLIAAVVVSGHQDLAISAFNPENHAP